MNIYLIMPVRNQTYEQAVMARDYVKKLEYEGHKVHYPPRDVDQTDDGCGLKICDAHRQAMSNSDEVHVIWDSNSKGSHFDLGMAFMARAIMPLPIVLVELPEKTPNKSYTNVLIALAERDKQDAQDSNNSI